MGVNTSSHDKDLTAASKRLVLAASIAALFCGLSAPALAVDMEDIVEKLREKGVISEEEYQEMRTDVRAEKRKAALERAIEEEHAVKKQESAPSELKGTFKDGFRFESGDKQHSIGLSGRVHADYRSFTPSRSSANTFDIRRARLGIGGKVYGDINFEVVGEFAGTSATLDVAYINFGQIKNAQVRVGQFKMPFNLETLVSSNNIDFIERSFGSNLAPGKERGLMVHGAPFAGFTYAVALANGTGQNNNDTVQATDDKDAIGRIAFNFAEMAGRKDLVTHLGLGYTTGTQGASAATSGIRTEGRGITFFTGANPGVIYDRERLGLEAAIASGPFKLQGEWINVTYSPEPTSTGNPERELDTYYVNAMWAITGENLADTYRNGVFGGVKPINAYKKGGEGWGAFVLGLRYDVWDASGFPDGTSTGTREAEAITVGLNWHLNGMTRVMFNYVQSDFDTQLTSVTPSLDKEEAYLVRAQINW